MALTVGVPGSGKTLLRFMAHAPPWQAVPPETGFFPKVECAPASGDIGERELCERR